MGCYRISDDVEDGSPRNEVSDDPVPWESPSGLSQRQGLSFFNTRQRRRQPSDNALAAKHMPHKRQSRSLACIRYPTDADNCSVRSSSRSRRDRSPRPVSARWSNFVLKSHSSSHSTGAAAWREKSDDGGVTLNLPRIFVDGGFLWKIPYHAAGTPKRRWFQIKPAEGLLTTGSGRLVVRPTAGGGGSGSSNVSGQYSNAEICDDPSSMFMKRARVAWPLAFIWVDPERDLKKSPPREMDIEEIVEVARGHKTPAFWQQAAHRGIHTLPVPELCFSLMGRERTLDLAAESISEAKEWVRALAGVALKVKRGELLTIDAFEASSSPRCQRESISMSPYSEPVKTENTSIDPHQSGDRTESTVFSLSKQQQQHQEHALRAGPNNEQPALRHSSIRAMDFSQEHEVVGEGGEWSVDTLRAWRRRLFPAVSRGDVTAVLALFDQGCPVDLVQAGTGDTPLLLACRLGDIGMVGECLRRGSRNDPHPDFGQTALQAAVAAGQEACARLILETAAPSRSDVVVSNHKDPNRETPLYVACRRGHVGIVEALLHHGADLRLVDRDGNTPLHGAVGGGHAGALASLLDAGGDAVLEEKNIRGDKALHTAAALGHIACVQLLLGSAAEPK